MTLALEPCTEGCAAGQGSRTLRFVRRLWSLMPVRADYLSPAQERALDDPETRERFTAAQARRQWNPPAWWDHL